MLHFHKDQEVCVRFYDLIDKNEKSGDYHNEMVARLLWHVIIERAKTNCTRQNRCTGGRDVMATLKDVAKLANVDVSTVSRALNNTSYVHPDTKKKIFKAVEQLSYRPNLLAKGLKQGKRRTLGVVVPSVNLSIFGEIV